MHLELACLKPGRSELSFPLQALSLFHMCCRVSRDFKEGFSGTSGACVCCRDAGRQTMTSALSTAAAAGARHMCMSSSSRSGSRRQET